MTLPANTSEASVAVSGEVAAPVPMRRVASGAAVEVIGFVLAQAVRLGANLLLTRLLFPKAFGLLAAVSLLVYGLVMLTDVGLTQAIIRSHRGDDPDFLDTAWTLQFARGVALWVAACLLAWPVAWLFREPLLLQVIPVASGATLLSGLGSTRISTLRRSLRPLPIVTLEISAQAVGAASMVALAFHGLGVWALVVGGLVTAAIQCAGSHALPGRHVPRLRIEPGARREIVHFGRWIFASSAMTFAAGRGDQFLVGRLLGASTLGLYNIAVMLAELPDALANRVVAGVIYPMYSRLQRSGAPTEFADAYYRARLAFDALVHTSLGGLIALAPWIIALLYDDRYIGAAPMLQALALRTSIGLVASPCETALIALGNSEYGFRRNLAVAVATMAAMPLGNAVGGAAGLIWGSTVARAAGLAVLWPAAKPRGLLRLHREALVVPFLAAGYAAGAALRWLATS